METSLKTDWKERNRHLFILKKWHVNRREWAVLEKITFCSLFRKVTDKMRNGKNDEERVIPRLNSGRSRESEHSKSWRLDFLVMMSLQEKRGGASSL